MESPNIASMKGKRCNPKVVVKSLGPTPSRQAVTRAVRAAIEALGGVERFVRRGDRVVLKPNVARALEPGNPENTDWRVVDAVAGLVREAGAGGLAIAEGAFGLNTPECFESTGIGRVARRHGAQLLDVNGDEFVRVRVPGGVAIKEVAVARAVREADCLINLPAFKASIDVSSKLGREYPISMGMKNLKGVISPANRKRFHDVGYQKAVADLNSVVRSDLVVMSGLRACVTEAWAALRRHPGLPLGLILAGDDVVAVDAVAATIVGYDPLAVEQIRIADEKGWGCADLSRVEVASDVPLAELRAETVQRVFEARAEAARERPLPVVIHDFDACTGCRAAVLNALNQARSELRGKRRVHVALGRHAERVPRVRRCVYVGGCTALVCEDDPHVRGCPPSEEDILKVLKRGLT